MAWLEFLNTLHLQVIRLDQARPKARVRIEPPRCTGSWQFPRVRDSAGSRLLHHLHDDRPGPGQDQVTDSPVVLGEDIQSVHRHHKLAHLRKE